MLFPAKQRIAFAFLTATVTTAIVSFAVVLINVGLSEPFLGVWFKSWLLAHIVAFPVILVVSPMIKRVVDFLFEVGTESKKESPTSLINTKSGP